MHSIFLCHASEDKCVVESIQLALVGAGCNVFYDDQSLPPGGDYHARISAAIKQCDIFIFIASQESIAPGKFTLTELKFARERWPSPTNRVLPVAIDKINPKDLPPYLQASTVLAPSGNIAAEVRAAVEVMLQGLKPKRKPSHVAFIAACSTALIFATYYLATRSSNASGSQIADLTINRPSATPKPHYTRVDDESHPWRDEGLVWTRGIAIRQPPNEAAPCRVTGEPGQTRIICGDTRENFFISSQPIDPGFSGTVEWKDINNDGITDYCRRLRDPKIENGGHDQCELGPNFDYHPMVK
jgi:hypothetical protein